MTCLRSGRSMQVDCGGEYWEEEMGQEEAWGKWDGEDRHQERRRCADTLHRNFDGLTNVKPDSLNLINSRKWKYYGSITEKVKLRIPGVELWLGSEFAGVTFIEWNLNLQTNYKKGLISVIPVSEQASLKWFGAWEPNLITKCACGIEVRKYGISTISGSFTWHTNHGSEDFFILGTFYKLLEYFK